MAVVEGGAAGGRDSAADRERLLALSSDLLGIVGPSGLLEGANPAWHSSLGLTPADLAARPYAEFVYPDDRAAMGEELRRVARDGAPGRASWRMVGHDGAVRRVLWRLAPSSSDGAVLLCGTVPPVESQAAMTPHGEQEMMRVLLDTVEAGIVACDATGTLLLFNQTARAFHGLPEAPLPPEQWAQHYNLYHADGCTPMAMEEIPLYQALRGERVDQVEMTIVARDQSPRTVLASGRAIVDAWGQTLGAVVAMHDITARKQAETALAASEARYRAIFENVQDVFYRLDAASIIVDVSPSCLRAGGYTREELIGRPVESLYPDPTARSLLHERLQAEGEVQDMEVRLRHKDGRLLYVSVNCRLLVSPQGQPLGVEGVLRDITARKVAETAVRESNARAQALLAALDVGVLLTYRDGRVGIWNESAARILGLSDDQLRGIAPLEPGWRVLREDGTPAWPASRTRLNDPEHWRDRSEEVMAIHKPDGAVTWASITSRSIVREGEETPFALVASVTDVTQRREVVSALERERRQLREVVRGAPVAMALLDRERRYLAYSRRWAEDYHLEGRSLIGQTHDEVLGGLPARWQALFARVLAGEAITDSEDVWEHAGGTREHIRFAINPWYDASGEVGGMVIASIGVDDLVAAREAALETARLKSEFLATMSHEIRTPLSGIIGVTELLLETPLSGEQRDYVSIARESGEALLTLINSILDFSKIEAGKLTLEVIEFDLAEVVESTAELFGPRALARGLTLTTSLDPDVPAVLRGDPGRLRQILLNLLSNAVKFTERGGVSVRVSVETQDAAEMTLRVTVTDSGIGLSEVARRRLFQPFVQADGSTTRKYGGTGLGLSISSDLVALMGGEMGVESEEGKGSSFWFTVRLARSPLTRAELTAGQGDGDPPIRAAGAGRRQTILLAEDNAVNRLLTEAQLRGLGYDVHAVTTGREAVAAAARGGFAACLMDCLMPETDGYTATRLIRAAEAHAGRGRLPILALTAHALPGDREACLAAGMDDYLTKPLRAAALDALLRRWVAPAEDPPDGQGDGGRPLLDLSILASIAEMDEGDEAGLLSSLIDLYLGETSALLETLRAAAAAGDRVATIAAAHRLTGSSAGLGAQAVMRRSREIEEWARNGHSLAAGMLDGLARDYERTVAALERHRAAGGA